MKSTKQPKDTRKTMVRIVCVVLCVLMLLTGCSGKPIEMDRAMNLRTKLLANAVSFDTEITADYGDKTYTFSMNCKTDTKGNLNFNCLLMLCPEEVQDYVVVHELCHRLEMNHSPAFWEQVERVLPDYQKSREWLKEHEKELIGRL